ncbi:Uncharacterized [Moorella glycerini]|uniref:DUF1641 domain-containing protein n=1 Tax=Neomoorella stamsii TaxID=1266720 RepID=A0A9X7J180_9FIRM|nr:MULTISPECIES: hypothetical protein [Moorella]PRR68910.1 hypothetical protein MOST_31920 [Moorella stamsii]CEP67531.1 Uncharacterized [Moorella glycerini]
MFNRDAEKQIIRLQAPQQEKGIAAALAGLEEDYQEGEKNASGSGLLADSTPAPTEDASPGLSPGQGQNQPLTLAAHSQALFREAILNGSVNQVLAELRVWIEKIRTFLLYADTGIETAGNIVNIAKGTLEKELGLAPAASTASTTSMQLPASSLQLVWNLIRTPEFQQFTGRMLAQVLKMGLNPPPQGESSG